MQKLKITQCELGETGEITGMGSEVFTALLNPASLAHALSIDYSPSSKADGNSKCANRTKHGQTAASPKFSAIKAETLSFDLVLDGTGVVRKGNSEVPDVQKELKNLKNAIYRFDGEKHEPNVVKLSWDEPNLFYGRMTNMKVDYTLFKPSGKPLRAKVSLSFVSYMSPKEAALRASMSSPDLSHLVEVRDGDTLPLLCQRIYNSGDHYLTVARENKLANFRDLEPGSWLRFPPLR